MPSILFVPEILVLFFTLSADQSIAYSHFKVQKWEKVIVAFFFFEDIFLFHAFSQLYF